MLNFVRNAIYFALLLLVIPTTVFADDFASDLAACAKGPIDATKFTFADGKTAAEFVANHSECVPPVVAGDPLLYGLSATVAVLQQQGTLPDNTQGCIDVSIGQASQPVASALREALSATGLQSLLPPHGQALLAEIADGQSQATLYQVPGVALVMDRLSCSCAVASTGIDADKLADRISSVVAAVDGCGALSGKLVSGAYDAGAAVLGAAGDTASVGYETAKGIVNSAGCSVGLGGCGDDGPPLFCDGYNGARADGMTAAQFRELFTGGIIGQTFAEEINRCEQAWADEIANAAKKAKAAKANVIAEAAYQAEQKRIAQETEKAEKLGAANALGFAFYWSPKCKDDKCKASIAKMTDQYTAELEDPDIIAEYGSFGATDDALGEKYNARAKLTVAISEAKAEKLRKIRAANNLVIAPDNEALLADVNAPATDRLAAFGCQLFLGHKRQWSCNGEKAFAACLNYAQAGEVDLCSEVGTPARYFATGPGLNHVLRKNGCIPNNKSKLTAQCLSRSGRYSCDAMARGGSGVKCKGPAVLTIKTSQIPAQDLPVLRVPLRLKKLEISPADDLSTLCQFTSGPREGESQDYAPMAPIPIGNPCHDGEGSNGIVVAP